MVRLFVGVIILVREKGLILYEVAESELVTYVTVVTPLIITDVTSVTLRTSHWYPSLA